MLTQHQKDIVKTTVPILRKRGETLTQHFYNRMLYSNPTLKDLFNVANQQNNKQARALASAILSYAENIEQPNVLLPMIERVCHKHVSLGIQAIDYTIVGENFIASISEVLNIPMTHARIDAWKVAYHELAMMFINTEKRLYEKQEHTYGGWRGWREFIVKKKVQEDKHITNFFLIPKDGLPLPEYDLGQYVSVRLFIEELGVIQPRQYRLFQSALPDCLRISVAKEEALISSQLPEYVALTLQNKIQENDIIELSAPMGF